MGRPHLPQLRDERLRARDRLWSATRTTILDGPLELPPVEDLRAAAAVLATAFPAARLGQRLDVARGLWSDTGLTAAQAGERAVVVHRGPDPEEVGVAAFARAVEVHRTDDVPVRWVVAGRHLALLICHAAGDGALMLGLPAALLETARTGRAPAWTEQGSAPAPLLRALAHHFGRHPRRVAATLGAVREGHRGRTGAGSDDGAGVDVAGILDALRPPGPTPGAPFRPSSCGVHAVMGAAEAAELTAWRRSLGPRTSSVAVQAALVQAALEAVGLPPQGPPTVLVDARRYLPPGAVVHGNFVAGLQLPVGQRWEPRALSAALSAAVADARPLSAMTLGTARQLLVRPGAEPRPGGHDVELVPALPLPVVAVTSMKSPHVEELPWAGHPAQSVATSFSTAAPAQGVTASLTESRQHVHLSLSFHDSVFDAALLAEAARLATSDPVGLLEGASASRGAGARSAA